ncbi:MAG: protein kinase [Myxococcales bacterium]|nr:protein kinase [Myxococcales bacterium]
MGQPLGIDEDEPKSDWEKTVRKDVHVGRELGEYVVEKRIGAGGMGIVYEGRQRLLDRKVAIKFIRPELSHADLLAEAKNTSAVRHRGIVDVFSFGDLPGIGQYMVMEFLDGTGLNQLIAERSPMASHEVIEILDAALAALTAAHAEKVIHRDLKPSNIFLARESSGSRCVKLLDFGLAQRRVPDEADRPVGIAGSLHYLPPEMARGQPATAQSDLYSLGVVAFEMLTGKVPFDGTTAAQIVLQQINTAPPKLSQFAPVPDALGDWVLGLLSKDPAKRPFSADSARRDLLRIGRDLARASTQVGEAPAPRAEVPPGAATVAPGAKDAFEESSDDAVTEVNRQPGSSKPGLASPEVAALAAPAPQPAPPVLAPVPLPTSRTEVLRPASWPPPDAEEARPRRVLLRAAIVGAAVAAGITLAVALTKPEPVESPSPAPPVPPEAAAVSVSAKGAPEAPGRSAPPSEEAGEGESAPGGGEPPEAREAESSVPGEDGESGAPEEDSAEEGNSPEEPKQAASAAGDLRDKPQAEVAVSSEPGDMPKWTPPRKRRPRVERAAPTPPVPPGWLEVTPAFGWADVKVDGVVRCRTPPVCTVELKPGVHLLEMVGNPHLEPYSARVTLRSGETVRQKVRLRRSEQ